MKIAIMLLSVAAIIGGATHANAKVLALKSFSPEEVRARCAQNHGAFFQNGGGYGCAFSKGLVRCDPEHRCSGYPKQQHAAPRTREISPQFVQPDYERDRWYRDQQQW